MKISKFEILKRNRKYFACQFESGCKFKLMINEFSKDLDLGTQELGLDDISVRSKYGTDLIYQVSMPATDKEEQGICTLKHFAYNSDLVAECKKLGGRWDAEEKVWVFSDIVEAEVEALDDLYNSELVPVELTCLDDVYAGKGPYEIFGYTLARAFGRDSGAKIGELFSLISGRAPYSAGSMKNWSTEIAGGSVFRAKLPKKLVERGLDHHKDKWEVGLI